MDAEKIIGYIFIASVILLAIALTLKSFGL